MSRPARFAAALVCCLFCAAFSFAQNIKGVVKDSLGNAVSFASVNLKNSSNLIIGYTVTTEKGTFVLPVPADAVKSSLVVEVSSVGFKKQSKTITDINAPCNFKLSTATNQLQTVIIKDNRPRLKTSGDTTSYKVSDFANPQDRVIGDVIKKLPGVQVASDGKISYNGKNISGVYIGGDNLLDDKYNIATNTIPHAAVDQVQVIENHQPIKMLRNKVVSDDVALNLTIKKDAKMQVVGQESIGAGVPDKYNVDLNAMMFKDQYKAINYLKGNNTGYDLQGDVVSHNLSDYLSKIDNDKPSTILSLGTVGDPDLPRNRYLFNQSGILNLNNLIHIKKDELLRLNVYYLHDTQKQDYQKQSDIYLPNDTVHYTEIQHNKRGPDLLHAQFLWNVNKDKYYLNDNFSTDYNRNTGNSDLIANGVLANQVFKDNLLDLSNEFNLMNTGKSNNITEVYSYINRSSEPENRTLGPGYEAAIFNHNIPYVSLTQNANIPTWFTNNYISYKIPQQYVTQSYKAGFSLQSQTLNSDLTALQTNNTTRAYSDSSINNLNWTKSKIYAEAGYDVPGTIIKATVTLPVNWQQIHYSDARYALEKSLSRLYFNPSVQLKYQSGVEDYFTIGYRFKNDIGNIQDVYRGDILTNYRTLYANNADLTERQTQTASMGYNYHKAITLFFFSLNASYMHSVANNITTGIISNNIQQRIVLPFENAYNVWTGSGYISKYLFDLRTTVSAGLNYQSAHSNQILNGLLLPYNTINTTEEVGADTKVSDKVNFSYKASYTQVSSKSSAYTSTSEVKRLLQQASINYNPSNSLYIRLSGDDYYTHQENDLTYIFADASARYRFNKKKIDLELSVNNLFNTKTYSALYLSANTFTSNTYTIPGRFALLKVMFNL